MPEVDLTIHRSARTIGGNCIELSTSDGYRLLLDAGRPLDTPDNAPTPIPSTLDLSVAPCAVLLSHLHTDHVGMLQELPGNWPVWCGAATAGPLQTLGDLFSRPVRQQLHHWQSGQPFEVGPFRITPILTDHSAFDAHMLLLEVHGRRILYSGDFRDHGRKGSLVAGLLASPPPDIDVLLMECTNLGSNKPTVSEEELEGRFVNLFRETPGRVFVSTSSTNIDRMVTLYRACLKADRVLTVDLFAADMLCHAAEHAHIPHVSKKYRNLELVVTRRMRSMYERGNRLHVLEDLLQSGKARSADSLSASVPARVILARPGLLPDYAAKGVQPDADDCWVWSLWHGYRKQEMGEAQAAFFAACRQEEVHTSGHASAALLKEFIERMDARLLVPIHGDPQRAAADPDWATRLAWLEDGRALRISAGQPVEPACGDIMATCSSTEQRMSRGLGEEFMKAFQGDGILSCILDEVRNDDTLDLQIRKDEVHVYYRGGKIMGAKPTAGGYAFDFDENYFIRSDLRIDMPPARVATADESAAWVRALPSLKRAMNHFLTRYQHIEREYQQVAVRENTYSQLANATEHFIIDIEYCTTIATADITTKFDMLGIMWPANERSMAEKRTPRLTIFEVKYGDNSLSGSAGMVAHMQNTLAFLRQDAALAELREEVLQVFRQKGELGLIRFSEGNREAHKRIPALCEKTKPFFVFLLANHNPRSKALRNVLTSSEFVEAYAALGEHADILFSTASSMGYALFHDNMLTLEQFKAQCGC